jgi:hypothetical protein
METGTNQLQQTVHDSQNYFVSQKSVHGYGHFAVDAQSRYYYSLHEYGESEDISQLVPSTHRICYVNKLASSPVALLFPVLADELILNCAP